MPELTQDPAPPEPTPIPQQPATDPPAPDPVPDTVPQEQYAGMQRKYNHLFTQFNDEKAARQQAENRISELELQVSQLGVTETSLQTKINELTTTVQEKEGVLTKLSREKVKIDLVKQEFPDMVAFVDLVPDGDEEAMRNHFKLLSERVSLDAKSRADALVAGTTPQVGGTRGQPSELSLDDLWTQLETLDPLTAEYRKVADLYAAKRYEEQNK